MKLHGVAIAITGDPKNPEPQRIINLTCTTTMADEFDRYRRYHMPGGYQSFEIKNIDCQDDVQMTAAFNRVAHAVQCAVRMQEITLAQAKLPYRPLSLLIGQDMRVKYDTGDGYDIRDALIAAPTMEPNEIQKKENALFAHSLRRSVLYVSDFFVTPMVPTEQEKAEGIFERDKFVNASIIRNYPGFEFTHLSLYRHVYERFPSIPGGRTFIDELIKDAEWLGASRAHHYGLKNLTCTWVQLASPNPEYIHRKDLQDKAPIYSFIGWHPEIRQAAERGIRECLKNEYATVVQGNICIRSAAEPRGRHFQDLLHPRILDQIDVARGVMGEDNPHEAPSRKQCYINWLTREPS